MIKLEISRNELEKIIEATLPEYKHFNNELLIKGGFYYIDCYGRYGYDNLNLLTDDELKELYEIIK